MRRFLQAFALGALAGGLFLAAMLCLDVGGFGTLVLHDRAGSTTIILLLIHLCGLFGIVVAVSSFGAAPGGGTGTHVLSPNLGIQRRGVKLAARPDCCINSNHPSA